MKKISFRSWTLLSNPTMQETTLDCFRGFMIPENSWTFPITGDVDQRQEAQEISKMLIKGSLNQNLATCCASEIALPVVKSRGRYSQRLKTPPTIRWLTPRVRHHQSMVQSSWRNANSNRVRKNRCGRLRRYASTKPALFAGKKTPSWWNLSAIFRNYTTLPAVSCIFRKSRTTKDKGGKMVSGLKQLSSSPLISAAEIRCISSYASWGEIGSILTPEIVTKSLKIIKIWTTLFCAFVPWGVEVGHHFKMRDDGCEMHDASRHPKNINHECCHHARNVLRDQRIEGPLKVSETDAFWLGKAGPIEPTDNNSWERVRILKAPGFEGSIPNNVRRAIPGIFLLEPKTCSGH